MIENSQKGGGFSPDFINFASNSVLKKSEKMPTKRTVDSKVSKLTVEILKRREGKKITNSLIAKKIDVATTDISALLKGQEKIDVVIHNKLKKFFPDAFKLAEEEIKLSFSDIFGRLTANKMSLENSLEIRKIINDLFWQGDPWKAAGKTKKEFIQEELNTVVPRINAMLSSDQKKMQMQLKSIAKYYLASPKLALGIRPILQSEHNKLTHEDKTDVEKILEAIENKSKEEERSKKEFALYHLQSLLVRALKKEKITPEVIEEYIKDIENS